MSTTESKKILITGVPKSVSPEVGLRQEINTFLGNPLMRNLYLLGLEEMQIRKEDDPRSWYQISGIHGLPYTAWNGEMAESGMGEYGYCTHSSHIFLTWHRAYLALFEQCLFDDIMKVAKKFNDPNVEEVARSFRAPYWDWAAFPKLHNDITDPVVYIRHPGATKDEPIPNPLARYKFQYTDVPTSVLGMWRDRPTTIRWGSDNTPQAKEEVADLVQGMDKFLGPEPSGSSLNIRDRLFMLLNVEQEMSGQSFKAFSSDRWDDNGRSSDYESAESIHNSLHLELGTHKTLRTNGHMSDPAAAGFDPIFWLHHCNVDRIWALWQAMHETEDANWNVDEVATIVEEPIRIKTVPWVELGGLITENTGLLPFRKNESTLWTSKDLKNPTVFNATYPELKCWTEGADRQMVRKNVTALVRSMYGPRTPYGRIKMAVKAAAKEPLGVFSMNTIAITPCMLTADSVVDEQVEEKNQSDLVTGKQISFASVCPPSAISTAEIPLEKIDVAAPAESEFTTHREYFANIRVRKFAFGGSFTVHVFIGQFSSDAKKRPTDPNLVGSFNVFATDVKNSKCQNCHKGYNSGLIVTGQIPLTGALLDRIGYIGSLDKDDVAKFLKRHLHWRLHREDAEHTSISRSELQSEDDLTFSVTSCLVDVPKAKDELVKYRDWNPIPEITEGRRTGTGFDNTEGYRAH